MGHRRPHVARTVIALAILALAWVLLLGVAGWIFRQPGVRGWTAARLSAQLAFALGQPVDVADIEVTLYPPRAVLHDVRLGSLADPLLHVRLVEVGLGRVLVAERELVINQLRLTGVRVRAEELPRLPAGGGEAAWVRVVVRQLELTDARIDSLALGEGVSLAARDIEVRWMGSRRTPLEAVVLHAGSMSLAAPGIERIEARVDARGRMTPQGFEVARLVASGGWGRLEAKGELAGRTLRAEGRADLALAELDRLLHVGAGLTGAVQLTGSATVSAEGFVVDARVISPRLEVVGFVVEDVEAETHITSEGLEASLGRGTFAGGAVEGSYSLEGFRPPWRHRVAARGTAVDLATFLRTIEVEPAGLAAECALTANLSWDGERIGEGSGTAVVDMRPRPGDVPAAGRVLLRLARDGALHFSTAAVTVAGANAQWEGGLTLGSWVPTWSVRGDHVPLAAVATLLRGWVGEDVLPAGLHGEAVFDVRLRGPFDDPTVVGDVAVAPVALGPIETDGVAGSFRLARGVLEVSDTTVAVGGGTTTVAGVFRYGSDEGLALSLSGEGIPIDRVAAWGGVRAPLAGRVAVRGTIGGTLASPQVDASLRLRGVAVAGLHLGNGSAAVTLREGVVTVADFEVGGLRASTRVDLQGRRAKLDATLKSLGLDAVSPPLARLAGGALDCELHGEFPFDQPGGRLEVNSRGGATGFVELDPRGLSVAIARPDVWSLAANLSRARQGYAGDFSFQVQSLQRLMVDLTEENLPVEGRVEGSGRITLFPRQPPRLEGTITRFDLEVEGESAALSQPAAFTVTGGEINVPGLLFNGGTARLFVRGGRRDNGELHGNVSGELPAALLAVLWPESRPSGRVELLGAILGTDREPSFEGVARVFDGSLRVPGLAAPLTRINGVIEFVPEALRLHDVDFAYSGGRGRARGRIALDPDVELDLGLDISDVRFVLAAALAPSLRGEIRLVGPVDGLMATGELEVQPTVYRRDLDLQRLVLEQFLSPVRATPTSEGAVRLNIEVLIPGTLEVETALARLTLKGDLRVVGTSAQPGVLGRVEVLPGGELTLGVNRYELDRGTVSFSNPDRIEPFLDVHGRTAVDSIDVSVSLQGTLDHLASSFSSNPPLAEMDILSLLALGTPSGVGGETSAGALATSFLSDQIAGTVARRARTLLDVDQLRLDPYLVSETNTPAARVTVVKRISQDWTVTYSTNLASNRDDLVKSRWRVSPGVFFEVNRDSDGSYWAEIKWQRRY